MTEHERALRDDIAFMRALAEEGAATPMLGGSILLAAGVIFGVAQGAGLLLQMSGRDAPWLQSGLPLGAMALFFIVLALLRRRLGSRPGANSPVNRATSAAWRGVGSAVVVLAAAFMLVAWRFNDWKVFALFGPVLFSLYGAGWLVSAAMTRLGWMTLVGYASFGLALGAAAAAQQTILAVGLQIAGLLLLVALPGFILMRQAPADVI
jgi:hypothetical protein